MKKPKPFKCMECGTTMGLRTAERGECPKCGGGDIDVNYESKPKAGINIGGGIVI